MAITRPPSRRPAWPRRAAAACAAAAALLVLAAAQAGLRAAPLDGEPITPVPAAAPAPAALLALGEALFGEARLSGSGRLSCASCHDLSTNGADARAHDVGADGAAIALNTATVFNAVLSFRLNWEGNVRGLAEQARLSLSDGGLMGGSPEAAAAAVAADPALSALYRRAYGRPPDGGGVVDAIAAFEATLVTPGSRFDLFLQGDASALSRDEQAGYALFKSIGCSSCHQGVNVGGNLWQRHGIFSPLASETPAVLRVPSLRNIADTAPYFHDGSSPTLEDAVSSMARAQLGRELSADQTAGIVAFLGTLTGRLDGRPVRPAR